MRISGQSPVLGTEGDKNFKHQHPNFREYSNFNDKRRTGRFARQCWGQEGMVDKIGIIGILAL
jgi:hypothetical protein